MLVVKHLSFEYSSSLKILSDLNFEVGKGKILAVLGESGSGKSTLLKLIYGLEDAGSGEIIYENKKVTGPGFNLVPGHPGMKFVPQEFDLLDYVSVAENVGKYLSNFDLPRKAKTIQDALEVVKMLDFKNEFPKNLSGGQRQRVSIARAIAASPKLLLLDEPYSHLDHPLKYGIRKNLWNWARQSGCLVVLTTHDANDALGFSDKILVLKEGKMIQNDSPENIRSRPGNEYVAGLLDEYSVLNSRQMKSFFGLDVPQGRRAILYPEEITADERGAEFEIKEVRFRGRDYLVEAERGRAKIKFYTNEFPETKSVRVLVNHFRVI